MFKMSTMSTLITLIVTFASLAVAEFGVVPTGEPTVSHYAGLSPGQMTTVIGFSVAGLAILTGLLVWAAYKIQIPKENQ